MLSKLNQSHHGNYLIKDVDVWRQNGVQSNIDVRVEEGHLAEIAHQLPANAHDYIISGKGKVLMPCGVDAQTHLRVPGQAHKETPETGILAALRGGYSAVLTMPNTQPTLDNLKTLKLGQDLVAPFEKRYGVHVFWSAAITEKLNSDKLTDLDDLVRAGVRAFTNDGLGVESDQVMDQAFSRLESLRVPLLQHAEFLGHGGSMAPGPVQRAVGAKAYPDFPEWKMVQRDIEVLRKHPEAQYHVLHVSSRKTIELIRSAKAEGLRVTGEASPHHLYFNCETIDPENKSFKMNPPIRAPEDQKELWQALGNGDIDFVATDHAPHEDIVKSSEFDKAAFGTIGLETTLPVLIDGYKKGYLNEARLVEVFSTAPARFLRLPVPFGDLVKNEIFHGVLVDVNAPPYRWRKGDFSSLSQNSCFIGSRLPGKVKCAFHSTQIFEF